MDSLAADEESLSSPVKKAKEVPETIVEEEKQLDSLENTQKNVVEAITIAEPLKIEEPLPSKPSSKLDGLLDDMEADVAGVMPDVLPLMKKKTTVLESMSAQQKFADE